MRCEVACVLRLYVCLSCSSSISGGIEWRRCRIIILHFCATKLNIGQRLYVSLMRKYAEAVPLNLLFVQIFQYTLLAHLHMHAIICSCWHQNISMNSTKANVVRTIRKHIQILKRVYFIFPFHFLFLPFISRKFMANIHIPFLLFHPHRIA